MGRLSRPRSHAAGPGPRPELTDHAGAPDGALVETAVVDEVLPWASWQPEPPALHFFRTHAGREVDLVLHAPPQTTCSPSR